MSLSMRISPRPKHPNVLKNCSGKPAAVFPAVGDLRTITLAKPAGFLFGDAIGYPSLLGQKPVGSDRASYQNLQRLSPKQPYFSAVTSSDSPAHKLRLIKFSVRPF